MCKHTHSPNWFSNIANSGILSKGFFWGGGGGVAEKGKCKLSESFLCYLSTVFHTCCQVHTLFLRILKMFLFLKQRQIYCFAVEGRTVCNTIVKMSEDGICKREPSSTSSQHGFSPSQLKVCFFLFF